MKKEQLKKLIDTAAGRIPADLVIKNCKVIDVYSGTVMKGDIAVCDGLIAGVGSYHGVTETDAEGLYASPGFIDSHIHIESCFVTPEEIGRLLTPHGATTIIADPHEIVNVCGIPGLDYMMNASARTALDIKFMLPSCVPATCFENSGAVVDASAMSEPLGRKDVLGLGEFMDYPGVVNGVEGDIDKLCTASETGKIIDGHSPGLEGLALNAYAAAGVHDDHECSTLKEMQERISRGMYVLMRQGSACHDLRTLVKGVTDENSRRCLLCSDDRQPRTIFEEGHIDGHLSICVSEGIDPVAAVRMASLNAAECFRLYDRGAIAPGLRADIVLLEDLRDFHVRKVYIAGEKVAENGKYLREVRRIDDSSVRSSMHVSNFSEERLKMHLKSGHVNVIELCPGSVVTKKGIADIRLTEDGDFIRDPGADIVKLAVIERHHNTGNVACALLGGYGIQHGAAALSVAHDSHNIIAAGVDNHEIAAAVEALIRQEGGIVLVKDGQVIDSMPMPIAGIMSDQSGEWVSERLESLNRNAADVLGINRNIDPVMTLCFMALPVIPHIKLTDKGLFDGDAFAFMDVEA